MLCLILRRLKAAIQDPGITLPLNHGLGGMITWDKYSLLK